MLKTAPHYTVTLKRHGSKGQTSHEIAQKKIERGFQRSRETSAAEASLPATEGRTNHEIASKNSLTRFLKSVETCAENTTPPNWNTIGVKGGQATTSHQKLPELSSDIRRNLCWQQLRHARADVLRFFTLEEKTYIISFCRGAQFFPSVSAVVLSCCCCCCCWHGWIYCFFHGQL